MDVRSKEGTAPVIEFTQSEFSAIAVNLRLFGDASVSTEIRANSRTSVFGRKVAKNSARRLSHGMRHGLYYQSEKTGRLCHERDTIHVQAETDEFYRPTSEKSVVVGQFTAQAIFGILRPVLQSGSSHVEQPEIMKSLISQFDTAELLNAANTVVAETV